MKKTTLLLFIVLLLTNAVFAQRKTTSVKSYYRKDGTYVSSHTRSYTPGSSSSSDPAYTAYASTEKNVMPTTLKLIDVSNSGEAKSNNFYPVVKGKKITLTTLKFINDKSLNDTSKIESTQQNLGIVFYVSVLRYNGKTLDICPIPRGYSDWSFEKVEHKFSKKQLTTEDALDLISNYGWRIYNDEISKDFSYSYGDKGFPKYLTKTTEAIRVE